MSIHVSSRYAQNLANLEATRLLCDEIARAKKEGTITVNIPEVGQVLVSYENPAFLKLLDAYNEVSNELINALRSTANMPARPARRIRINKARIARNYYPFPSEKQV